MAVGGRESASSFFVVVLSFAVLGVCFLLVRNVPPVAAKQVLAQTPTAAPPDLKIIRNGAFAKQAGPKVTAGLHSVGTAVSADIATFPIDNGAYAILATPIAPTPAPTNVPDIGDPHVDYTATTPSCAACHRTHTAEGLVLRVAWPEEKLCFNCHSSEGPGTDVQSAFAGKNTATRFFEHGVAAVDGVHHPGETTGADFGGANRHVECEDCHEPHKATRGAADAPMLQLEMNCTAGVDPMWRAPGPPEPSRFIWLAQAEREYQVCFKCHSSYATLPTYVPDGWDGSQYVPDGLQKLTSSEANQVPDNRDMAQEFNPFNASFHPVVTVGRNSSIPAASFVEGWSSASMVYCTDCHTDSGGVSKGPHGSPRLHLLDGQADYTSVMTGSAPPTQEQELCFQCHDAATYLNRSNASAANTNFSKNAGSRNLHGSHMTGEGGKTATCYSCHDSHGSEQDHLLNFEVIPGVLEIEAGDSQSAWRPNGSQMECAITCHGRSHTRPGFRYP